MADRMATAKAALAESQKLVDESHAEYKERTKGTCTPTQEECDLIKLGAPVVQKKDPGAGAAVDYRPRAASASPRPAAAAR